MQQPSLKLQKNLQDPEDLVIDKPIEEYTEEEITQGLFGEQKLFIAQKAPSNWTSDVWKHFRCIYMRPHEDSDQLDENAKHFHKDYFTGYVVHDVSNVVMKKRNISYEII